MSVLPNQIGSAAGIPISEQFANVAGHRMRYLNAGAGPRLVLIHGLLAYSFSWRFNIPALAPYFTVYAPDLLGIGYSDRVPGLDCSLRASAARTLGFVDRLGLDRFDLLGTSHGGALAAMMASLAPERIRRLVLVAPVNPWSAAGRRRTRVLGSAAGAWLFRRAFPYLGFLNDWVLRRLYADPRRIPPGTLEGYLKPVPLPHTLDYLLDIMRCWHADLRQLESVYPKLAGIPTLLIWGDRDPAVLPASAQRLRQMLPRSELVMMAGIGHLPYEEAPEEFNRAVLEFLRRP